MRVGNFRHELALKSAVIGAAAVWHAWLVLPVSPAGLMFGVLPYILLVMAWDFIGTATLLVPALAAMIWSSIDAGLAFRHSTSSTAGVGLLMQQLFGCGVVGAACLIRLLIPRRGPASRDP
jgi:hypothetical protein